MEQLGALVVRHLPPVPGGTGSQKRTYGWRKMMEVGADAVVIYSPTGIVVCENRAPQAGYTGGKEPGHEG